MRKKTQQEARQNLRRARAAAGNKTDEYFVIKMKETHANCPKGQKIALLPDDPRLKTFVPKYATVISEPKKDKEEIEMPDYRDKALAKQVAALHIDDLRDFARSRLQNTSGLHNAKRDTLYERIGLELDKPSQGGDDSEE